MGDMEDRDVVDRIIRLLFVVVDLLFFDGFVFDEAVVI